MKKVLPLFIIFLFLLSAGCCKQGTADEHYVILISFDGFRYDYADSVATPALHKMEEDGVRAFGLKPIFPSKTFPNHYSIATGLYAENHGIVANKFFDPDMEAWYSLGDPSTVRDKKWYGGEPIWVTAEKNKILTASYYWVGSEAPIKNIPPTYFYYYNQNTAHSTLIKRAKEWLQLPDEKRPHLILLYFHDTDDKGHLFGPLSAETNMAVQSLDSVILNLRSEIADINMQNNVDIILVSDHGMRSISEDRVINIENFIDVKKNIVIGSGPLMNIHFGKDQDGGSIYKKLKENEKHYSVYKREEIPQKWHYRKSNRIGDVIIVAEPGWQLITNRQQKKLHKYGNGGIHGYDNDDPQMRGIFYAVGPDFKKGLKTQELRNIDIYPLIADLLHIKHLPHIDGSLDSIRFVLKNNDQ